MRIGYVQTVGGAFPGALSDIVRELRERGLLAGHVTAGAAFGGEEDAITVAGALQAGFAAEGWDAAIAGPGPGILGSATMLGHGGLAALDTAHAALALSSRTLLVPRMSQADPRPRHHGLSHHTTSRARAAARAGARAAAEGRRSGPRAGARAARERRIRRRPAWLCCLRACPCATMGRSSEASCSSEPRWQAAWRSQGRSMGFERIGVETESGRAASPRCGWSAGAQEDGEEVEREVVGHPGAVGVVAHDGERIYLVSQPREPVGEPRLLELPAGKLDDEGENVLDTAKRELAEEIGKGARSWRHLTTFYASPGFSDEEIHVYLATDLYEQHAEATRTSASRSRPCRSPSSTT